MKLVAALGKELRQEVFVSLDEFLHATDLLGAWAHGTSQRRQAPAYRIHAAL
jgi:hypothetical protein